MHNTYIHFIGKRNAQIPIQKIYTPTTGNYSMDNYQTNIPNKMNYTEILDRYEISDDK